MATTSAQNSEIVANTSVRAVERNGTNPVPDSERHGRPRDLFWPWAASNLSLLGVAYGVYLVQFGLNSWQAMLAGALGYVLSFVLVGVISVAGPRMGLPTMTHGRVPFGFHGNKLPSLFSYISNVGWETVLVTLSAMGGATVLARIAPSTFGGGSGGSPSNTAITLCFAVTVVTVLVAGVYGHALIMRAQQYLTWALVVMTVLYIALVSPKIHLSGLTRLPTGNWLLFVGGVVFAMTLLGLGWVNCGADYSRYLPSRASGAGITTWTTLGGVLPPLVLLVLGVLLTGSDPKLAAATSTDPVSALAASLPTWFLVPYLLTALAGFISGAIMDIYSSGLSMLALGVPLRRHLAVLVDGALMVLGGWYLLFESRSFLATFEAFLSVIGVLMAAWAAIFIVDMARQRRLGYDLTLARAPHLGGVAVRWQGVTALAVATVVGLGMITSADTNIAGAVGFLLTRAAKNGSIGSSGLGVVVALLVAGGLYAALTACFTRGTRLGTRSETH